MILPQQHLSLPIERLSLSNDLLDKPIKSSLIEVELEFRYTIFP